MTNWFVSLWHRLRGARSQRNQLTASEDDVEPDRLLADTWVSQLEHRVSESEANARILVLKARERSQRRPLSHPRKEPSPE